METESKKLVLILGGSNFMGKYVLELFASDPRYEVYYINRGKRYWDDEVQKFKNAHYTYGNRDESNDYTKLLKYVSSKLHISEEKKWEVVIDFCAFYAKHVKGVYTALQGLTNLYILISTDSIYDVCDRDIRKPGQPLTEDMGIRPQSEKLYIQYREEEDYGHDKLKCEEFLMYHTSPGFNYVSLRLPDVIGPYDDTGRFWAYVKWIQQREKYPIEEDNFSKTQQLSFVYSKDVGDLIKRTVDEEYYKNKEVINQTYNICFEESITIHKLVQTIAQSMKLNGLIFKETQRARKFYPSVECGSIDGSKAQKLLGFKSSSWNDAIQNTVNFFLNIQTNQYKMENDKAEKKLHKKLADRQ